MKRMTLIAVALCLIMLTTVGAGVVAAKQTENPRQAGASSIVFYDVKATDEHGAGKFMINVKEGKFVFNGKGFDPGKTYALHYKTASSATPRVFASAVATPPGNLHVEGTWTKDLAAPTVQGFGVGATVLSPGTIQRVAGAPCYTLLLYYGGTTHLIWEYLPSNTITSQGGGTPLPSVIPNPVAVDSIALLTSSTLSFNYQGVSYSADYADSCPYKAPIPSITGSYSPYKVWNHDLRLYDWYWNLDTVTTWDASHLPPGVGVQRVGLQITAVDDLGQTHVRVSVTQYGSAEPFTWHDGYTWVGCYSDTLCPPDEWVTGPPFVATATVVTTDGNLYSTSITLPPAS